MEKLEGIFKSKLENFETPVSEAVWQEVSKSILKQKRKKRLFLFLIVVFLLFALIGGYFAWNSGNTKKPPKKEPVRVQTAQFIEKSDENIKNLEKEIVHKDVINVTSTSDKETIPPDKITSNLDNTFTSPSSINISQNNLITSIDNFLPENNETQFSIISSSNIFSNTTHFSNSQITLLPTKNIKIQFLNRMRNIEKSDFFENIKKKRNPGILNDCFPIKSNSWFFELFFSPDFNKKSLIGDDTAYINSRLNTEKAAFSFSSGFKLGYKFRNNLVLRSGFEYLSIKEKFHVVLKELASTQTIITIDTINHSDGSTEIVRDTTIKENYNDKSFDNVNSLTMINIPIIFGYEFKNRNNSFGLNMGVIINLISNNKAQILNKFNEVIDLENSGNIFNNGFGIALYNSIYYARSINSKYDLFVEPKLKYYLKTFAEDNYPVQEKYVNFAFSLGARYHF